MAKLIMSSEEAVEKFVHDGYIVAIGGFTTNRKPYVLVREIIRQGKKDLYIGIRGRSPVYYFLQPFLPYATQ